MGALGKAEFFHGRRLRYQILVLIEDRWQLVAVINDDREELAHSFDRTDYDTLEAGARNKARAMLGVNGIKAVRLIRERLRADGYGSEEEILNELAPVIKPIERQVSNYNGAVPICAEAEDMLNRPAQRVVGMIMRPLLDKLGMTPIELVTLKAVASGVKRAENAVSGAITAAARLQAQEMNVAVRVRINEVEKLAEKIRTRVRIANEVANPPKIGKEGIDAFLTKVTQRFPQADWRFWSLRGLAELLAPDTNYVSKLERLLALRIGEISDRAEDLIDEVAASIADHQDVIRELLGRQADLATAMLALADLALGKPPAASSAPELAANLARTIAQGKLSMTRDALWDRLHRSLAGQQRLSNNTLREEWLAIHALQSELLPRVPESFKKEIESSLLRRQTRTRDELSEEIV
ncbi:MAG TPA: hypothetical protein VM689_07845 [Aliidongia sp.]|nr:hypothetical protein [Aliidongia sp.]